MLILRSTKLAKLIVLPSSALKGTEGHRRTMKVIKGTYAIIIWTILPQNYLDNDASKIFGSLLRLTGLTLEFCRKGRTKKSLIRQRNNCSKLLLGRGFFIIYNDFKNPRVVEAIISHLIGNKWFKISCTIC